MSDFIELVFTYLSGLTSYLTWETVKFVAGAIGILWVGLAFNRRFGLLEGVSDLAARLFGSRVEELRSRGEAATAEKAEDWCLGA